jgi:hypothetical protein
MPTNSDYDRFFSGIDGIPMFTYGMIASTIVVLSYMTFMEEDLPDEMESSVLSATVTSPIPPDALTGIGEEGPPPMSLIPEEIIEPAVPEEENANELPTSSVPEEDVDEQPPQSSVGGKNKKRRITKRRRPQA